MSLERQNKLIAAMENEPIFCPACKGHHSVKECRIGERRTDDFKCPITGDPLHHGLELFGGAQFWAMKQNDL